MIFSKLICASKGHRFRYAAPNPRKAGYVRCKRCGKRLP